MTISDSNSQTTRNKWEKEHIIRMNQLRRDLAAAYAKAYNAGYLAAVRDLNEVVYRRHEQETSGSLPEDIKARFAHVEIST